MLLVVACESFVEVVAPVMAVRPLATLLDPSTVDPLPPPLFVAPLTAGRVLLLLLLLLLLRLLLLLLLLLLLSLPARPIFGQAAGLNGAPGLGFVCFVCTHLLCDTAYCMAHGGEKCLMHLKVGLAISK